MNSVIKTCDKIKSDEILYDAKIGKKEKPWREKKVKSLVLVDSYNRLDMDRKAGRVSDCGTFLEFKRLPDGQLKLNKANFCKVRLCPMCAWRRELKIFGQVSQVMDYALQERDYRFLFLTLTCRNVPGEKLGRTIDQLMHAYKKFTERKQVKKSIKGWFRALEITHNVNRKSSSFNTFHPHFHVILMVNKSYFDESGYYLSQKKWTSLWRESMRLDYTPIVDVRTFKAKTKEQTAKSVAEVAKYTVKDSDYLLDDDPRLTDKTVAVLDTALANRRLVAFGGRLKEIHKLLALGDATDGDLIHTDNEELREDVEYIIERYQWHIGYRQYFRMKED